MERTRGIFRRPVVWIILVIIGAIALDQLLHRRPGVHEGRHVGRARRSCATANVKKAVLEDREQNLSLDLNKKIDVNGQQTDHIIAQYPGRVDR